MHQIENVRGIVAPFISQHHVMETNGTTIEGNHVVGQSSASFTRSSLNLFLTEETAAAENPPYELSILLADLLGIQDSNHRSLLYTVLISSNLESTYSTFTQQGIETDKLIFGKCFANHFHLSILETDGTLDKSKRRYQAQRGDLSRIPSPFWGSKLRLRGSESSASDVLKIDHFRKLRNKRSSDKDRRLPMNELTRPDGSIAEDVQATRTQLIGWEHIQHLGEHFVSSYRFLGDLVLFTLLDIENLTNSSWASVHTRKTLDE
jgi:hypothetical protein